MGTDDIPVTEIAVTIAFIGWTLIFCGGALLP